MDCHPTALPTRKTMMGKGRGRRTQQSKREPKKPKQHHDKYAHRKRYEPDVEDFPERPPGYVSPYASERRAQDRKTTRNQPQGKGKKHAQKTARRVDEDTINDAFGGRVYRYAYSKADSKPRVG